MESAVELAGEAREITLADLLGIHQILMERSPTPKLGGVIREEQNWIGGSSYNPCSASFVPPPSEHVQRLLEDLTAYINEDKHPALVQAAISLERALASPTGDTATAAPVRPVPRR